MPSVSCPHCSKKVTLNEQHRGHTVKCPGCDGVVDITGNVSLSATETELVDGSQELNVAWFEITTRLAHQNQPGANQP